MQSILNRPQVLTAFPVLNNPQENTVICLQGHVNSTNIFAFQDELTKAMMCPGSQPPRLGRWFKVSGLDGSLNLA